MADLRLRGCSAAQIHKSQRVAAHGMQGAVKKDGAPVRWLNNPAADAPPLIDRE